MTAQEYAFAVIAAVGSISAIAVVTARNVVHAALYLVVALLSVGATFLLLGAEFAGWVQILIYVGAIVILFLFGLMLTKAPIGRDTLDNNRRWLGALVAIGVFAGLVFLIQEAFPFDSEQFEVFRSTTAGRGGVDVPRLRAPVRGDLVPAARGLDRCDRARPQGRGELT